MSILEDNYLSKLNKISLIVPGIFFLLYIFLPVKVSSIDGYGFAFLIKNGEDLFLSHHLLYNFFGFLWCEAIGLFGEFETLAVLKIMNSLAAAISLFLLNNILKIIKVPPFNRIFWLVLVGASWGVMRFATENETYVLPVCFSLFGSFWFIKSLVAHRRLFFFYAGFFSALAALIHQIHFFWWLGIILAIFLRRKTVKDVVVFFLPSLLVPFVYLVVFIWEQSSSFSVVSFFHFIFNDYQSGTAELSIDLRNVVLTPVSFIRTFVQVHGYMFHLGMKNLIFIVVLLISLLFFVKSIMGIKNLVFLKTKFKSTFVSAHVFAFVLHFAFISHGNAEFMVMLPFLVAIIFSSVLKNYSRTLFYLSSGIFLWNVSFGLIPLSSEDVNGDKMVVDFILSKSGTKNQQLYILFNRPRVGNMVEYFNDSINRENLYFIEGFDNEDDISDFLRKEMNSGKTIYTDCVDRPFTMSRAAFLIDSNQGVFNKFKQEKIDSASSLSGTYFLTRISGEMDCTNWE